MLPYYDNFDDEPDNEGFVDIERIYCFDWAKFDENRWNRFKEICAMLPEPRNSASGWAWFSEEEDIESGYLHASGEPPGLQVYGTLPLSTWLEWDTRFRSLADGLPTRNLPTLEI